MMISFCFQILWSKGSMGLVEKKAIEVLSHVKTFKEYQKYIKVASIFHI